jgi:inward rectifier potassium channel
MPAIAQPPSRSDEDTRDLGFGSVVAQESRDRLLNRDGSFNVVRRGLGFFESLNTYHALLTLRWPQFLGAVIAFYAVVNALFAIGYLLCGDGALEGGGPIVGHGFAQAFFFSVETLATIGYGNIAPMSVAANALMTVESLIGLLSIALMTGLMFARFSRPTARIRFSTRALIAPYRGMRALMFRIANERNNQLVELEAKVILSRFEGSNGTSIRRFYELPLERRKVAFFPLSWTIVHPIDEQSPLRGLTATELRAANAELLVLLTGFDETFSQIVHTRSSYASDEIDWGAKFRNVFSPPRADRRLSIDIGRLDETDPAILPGVETRA